ncbi:unnamed protein product [Xylocopa violacea]|uniref:Odorant receptor n=1 Tax=Xylocopa violacea TaxID=135666 RepID=A0ABP1PEI6_XYLVO
MRKLSLSYSLLSFCGYWRPTSWSTHSFRYRLYNIYSVLMVLVLYFFTSCTCVDTLVSKDFKTMTDKFSLCISVIGVSLKVTNLFLQRKNILGIMDILTNKNCVPRDKQERILQSKKDRYARKLTMYCEILNESAVFFATVAQYNELIRTRKLPVSDWMPYDLSSDTLYAISLLYQTIGLMICANTSVGNETLIAGLMIEAGTQFEIFCHRARNLSTLLMETGGNRESRADRRIRYKRILKDLVEYHLEIYRLSRTINTVFQYTIFLQFSISSTVLCLSILKMSTENPLSVNFLWSGFYLCCMLMQVYLYCWFGNEVTLKSDKVSDAIYEMDWTMLPAEVKKDLLFVMTRSKKPVKMTSGHIVVLSVKSFMTVSRIELFPNVSLVDREESNYCSLQIMNTTYTSYNLLIKTTSK